MQYAIAKFQKVNEYEQVISQSQMKKHRLITTTRQQEHNQSKAPSSLLHSKMVCKTRMDTKYCITKERTNIKPLQTIGATTK